MKTLKITNLYPYENKKTKKELFSGSIYFEDFTSRDIENIEKFIEDNKEQKNI